MSGEDIKSTPTFKRHDGFNPQQLLEFGHEIIIRRLLTNQEASMAYYFVCVKSNLLYPHQHTAQKRW
jgi:hypothetical protein